MISLKVVILIGIGCFIFGELCGVFTLALLSVNKRFKEKYNEVQQGREETVNRSNQ